MRKLGDNLISEAEKESHARAQEMSDIRSFLADYMEDFVPVTDRPVAVAVPLAMVEEMNEIRAFLADHVEDFVPVTGRPVAMAALS